MRIRSAILAPFFAARFLVGFVRAVRDAARAHTPPRTAFVTMPPGRAGQVLVSGSKGPVWVDLKELN